MGLGLRNVSFFGNYVCTSISKPHSNYLLILAISLLGSGPQGYTML